METYKKLLQANRDWVQSKVTQRQSYFTELSQGQNPEFLWIGCSDSRVPAEDLTGCQPGELFVHRNIGNLVPESDVNALSVLQFAVQHLKVKHVIVCGHYGCGGVKHGMMHHDLGLLDAWIANIRSIYAENAAEFANIADETARWDHLVELNVRRQVKNVIGSAIVYKAWQEERRPVVHGWVCDLKTGFLKELETRYPE
ncbi:Carbonic anhydrase [Acidisarcina polymorpha]|uniref:Carbonic anhydrase n=1 Tax=Acidisarcina polymorpha TaxID=2211140 RepID=A0A2Z5FX12_9BACT|nr:carbonic anhydrase [Acidisarcina polymorpha]AXC11037.1 Carbonic anhydrase [Acidisarcina polymorpha]